MPEPVFTFERKGRSWTALLSIAAIYAALFCAVIWLDAAGWMVTLLILPTLPALWEFFRNPTAGLRLSGTALEWHTGRHSATLDLAEIDHMRFDTRWDLSVRVTAILSDDKRLRLPPQSLPPHLEFESALAARGIRVERHHFRVF